MDDRRPTDQNERRNWKLLYDPIIKKGIQKLYRFEGIVPGNANANLSVRHLSDPRLISAKSRGKVDAADLHIPSFKVDENYVGKPPSTEVSFFDVNDNVSQSFLEDLCKKCGDVEEVRIFYHAKTKVHLGLGRVVFRKIKAAAYCVEKYNNVPIMGKPVRAMLDPLGKLVKKLAKEYSAKEDFVPTKNFFSATPDPCCPPSTLSTTSGSQNVNNNHHNSCSSQSNFTCDASTTPSSATGVPEDPMNNPPPPPPPPPPSQSATTSVVGESASICNRSYLYANNDDCMMEVDAASIVVPPPPPPPPPTQIEISNRWISADEFSPNEDLSVTAYNRNRTEFEESLIDDVMRRFIERVGYTILDQWCASQEYTASLLRSNYQRYQFAEVSASCSNHQANSNNTTFRNNFSKTPTRVLGAQQQRKSDQENFASNVNSIFGSGFRASLNNLPSFKRKPSGPVTPPPKKAESPSSHPIKSTDTRRPRTPDDDGPAIAVPKKGVPRSPSATPPPTPSTSSGNSSSESSSTEVSESEEEADLHQRTPSASSSSRLSTSVISSEKGKSFSKVSPCRTSSEDENRSIDGDISSDEENVAPLQRKRPRIFLSSRSSEDEDEEEENAANGKSLKKSIATTDSFSDEGKPKKGVSSEDDSGNETKLAPLKAYPTVKSGRNNDGSDLNAIAVTHSMQINDKCTNDHVKNIKDDKIVDLNFHHCLTNPTDSERKIDLLFDRMVVENEQTYRPDLYDHCYFTLPESSTSLLEKSPLGRNRLTIDKNACRSAEKENRRSEKKQAFKNIFNSFSSSSRVVKDLLRKEQPPRQPVVTFKPRDIVRETEILYKFLVDGIDNEDIRLLKLAYEKLTSEEAPYIDWRKVTHWAPHVATFVSQAYMNRKRKRNGSLDENPGTVHHTGSARTEGYYKVHKVKRGFLATARQATVFEQLPSSLQVSEQTAKQQLQLSREARSNQRRLLNVMGDVESDFFKFNQLMFRKKCIRFSKSKIHGWGLFAMEPIGPDEMVVEYVGEKVRLMVAEKREKHYEKMGIGSSYLFRLDNDWAIDATKQGAVARFINHSCNPSCYAKIISLDGEKRIVIYSKQNISQGEEITYDYKFPIEDVKIPCNCGSYNCRRSLN